jgi:hypothetical protein
LATVQEKLTPEICQAKAAECRELAKAAAQVPHKIMLEHMAAVWERICADLKEHTSQCRAVGHCTRAFVGIDVVKARNFIPVAEGERGGKVRYVGEVDASDETGAPLSR